MGTDIRMERGRAAFEIYREHCAESSRFYGGELIIPWEQLTPESQESWARHAERMEQPETMGTRFLSQLERHQTQTPKKAMAAKHG
jgi:hypothetical protein